MEVRHDTNRQRFVLAPDPDRPSVQAFLAYRFKGGGSNGPQEVGQTIAEFYAVYVPDDHRGQGYAADLADTAFAHAREAGWTVYPTCPYLTNTYLPQHPETRDLLT